MVDILNAFSMAPQMMSEVDEDDDAPGILSLGSTKKFCSSFFSTFILVKGRTTLRK